MEGPPQLKTIHSFFPGGKKKTKTKTKQKTKQNKTKQKKQTNLYFHSFS